MICAAMCAVFAAAAVRARAGCKGRESEEKPGTKKKAPPLVPGTTAPTSRAPLFGSVPYTDTWCHTPPHGRLYYAIQPLKQPDGGAPTPGLLLALAATRQALRCSPPPPPSPPPSSPRDSTKVRLASSSDGQLSRPLTFSS